MSAWVAAHVTNDGDLPKKRTMNKATASTFSVSDVSPATTPLAEVPYKEAVEALLNTSVPERRSRSAMPRPVEACARYHGQLVAGVPFHPVVAAVHRAFMDHRPLWLSPDIIWLMICQGVANHINANADALRSRFVRHDGKVKIRVRRDDFIKGSPENPWALAIEELTSQVAEHIGSEFNLFQVQFTTTGPVERAVLGVVLLDAMQSYFAYDVVSLCGIPAISLTGTPGTGRPSPVEPSSSARWDSSGGSNRCEGSCSSSSRHRKESCTAGSGSHSTGTTTRAADR